MEDIMEKKIQEKDNGYDGYYDDVKPEDFKIQKRKPQKDNGLKYKILLVILGALAFVMVSVIIMNLT